MNIRLLAFLAVLTVVRLVFIGRVELSPDEAQYYQWSQHLDWCYFSKGPGVALAIKLGTMLFGPSEFGIRFLAPILALGTSLILYVLARRIFEPRVAAWTVVLANATPIFNAGGLIMTIDPLSIFFWAAALYTLWRAFECYQEPDGKTAESIGWWAASGALIGFGFWCKWTNAMQLLSVLLLVVLTKRFRGVLKTPGFWTMLAIFALFVIPVALWNKKNGWPTTHHLAARGGLDTPWWQIDVKSFGQFVATHFGVYSPVIFVGMLVALWQATSDSAIRWMQGLLKYIQEVFPRLISNPRLSASVIILTLSLCIRGKWREDYYDAAYFTAILGISLAIRGRWGIAVFITILLSTCLFGYLPGFDKDHTKSAALWILAAGVTLAAELSARVVVLLILATTCYFLGNLSWNPIFYKIGSNLVVLTTLLTLRKRVEVRNIHWRSRFLAAFALPLVVMYGWIALHHDAEVNWTAPASVSLLILVGQLADRLWNAERRKLVIASVAVGAVISIVAVNPDLVRAVGVPWRMDRDHTARLRGWEATASAVQKFRQEFEKQTGKQVFLIGENYGVAAELCYYLPEKRIEGPGHPAVYVEESPVPTSQFHFWGRYDEYEERTAPLVNDQEDSIEYGANRFAGRTALYITTRDEKRPPSVLKRTFERWEMGRDFGIEEGGQLIRTVRIFICHRYKPGMLLD